jgi:osmotically-inducible protein OsmY
MVDLDSSLKESSIDFDANNGILTITGEVPNMATKEHVGEMARSEPGVRDVINSLEVKAGS